MNVCHIGDCREVMRRLIAEGMRVQTCVTSPPYWGLRDYGTAGQLGLESTPAEYVANMVEVFRLVRELLADDGVLWLNLGDSYANNPQSAVNRNGLSGSLNNGKIDFPVREATRGSQQRAELPPGLKPKDLVGIPWLVAFALRADGWYLRQDIIWAKPNPMPESVTDRCTKAHEYLFLLAKRERYYYDAQAIAEPSQGEWNSSVGFAAKSGGLRTKDLAHRNGQGAHSDAEQSGRNRRSVWTVPTAPYADAHFATFPPALIEPCIMAGSRVGDVVLDPFMGSGTVGQVAQDLGRRWLGIELNEAYAKLQERRTAQQAMVFT